MSLSSHLTYCFLLSFHLIFHRLVASSFLVNTINPGLALFMPHRKCGSWLGCDVSKSLECPRLIRFLFFFNSLSVLTALLCPSVRRRELCVDLLGTWQTHMIGGACASEQSRHVGVSQVTHVHIHSCEVVAPAPAPAGPHYRAVARLQTHAA